MTAGKRFVRQALAIRAMGLKKEGWRLKSDRLSPYFFDASKFYDGSSYEKLVSGYVDVITSIGLPSNKIVLLGPPYKGTLLVPSIALTLHQRGIDTSFASFRKEVKKHGEGGNIIGASLKGANVVVIDDVITTNDTMVSSFDVVLNCGGRVVACVVAFDRQEKSREEDNCIASQVIQEGCDVPVHSIAQLSDLIAVLQEGDLPEAEFLQEVLLYRERYGTKQK